MQAGGENMSIAQSTYLWHQPDQVFQSLELKDQLSKLGGAAGSSSVDIKKMNMCQSINLALDEILQNDEKAGILLLFKYVLWGVLLGRFSRVW